MPIDNKICLETPHLIMCEGRSACFFLFHLLNFLKNNSEEFKKFKVYDFGGITELKKYLCNIVKTDNFKQVVKSICIIRDAETDANGACQSIRDALSDCDFASPAGPCLRANGNDSYPQIATGFVLFPSCARTPRNGTLENLCLDILTKNDAQDVLSNADAALKPYEQQLPQLHKNRLHTYFSLTKEFVSLKIGEAAQAQAFSFQSQEINSLKSFLLELVR